MWSGKRSAKGRKCSLHAQVSLVVAAHVVDWVLAWVADATYGER